MADDSDTHTQHTRTHTHTTQHTQGDVEKAGEWLMTRMDDLDDMDLSVPAAAEPTGRAGPAAAAGIDPGSSPAVDHKGQYRLIAFIRCGASRRGI